MQNKELYVHPIPGNGPKKGQVACVGIAIALHGEAGITLNMEQAEQLYEKLKLRLGKR